MGAYKSEVIDGIRVDWDVPVKMDDGVELRCDVFRPDDDGRYPVMLGAGPYGKWLAFQDQVFGGQWKMLTEHEPDILKLSSNRFQNYEFADPERFVPDGYALVRLDTRGTGRSPGFLDLLSMRETQDLYECIEWAAKQPWSNGRIGLNGISYLAMNQWQVASLRPPSLQAMCLWEGCYDYYREFVRHGGILSQFGDLWYSKYLLAVQNGLGERGFRCNMDAGVKGEWVAGPASLSDAELEANRRDWRKDIRANPFATDEFWTSRMPDFAKITTPLLSSANWGGQGLHLRGNVDGFVRASSKQKWLNFHCFEHWTEFYTKAGVELQKRFFGHFLKDQDTGWGAEPKVMMQVRHPEKALFSRGEKDWPLPGTQWTKAYLDPSSSGLGWQPPKEKQALKYRASSHGLTFLSQPLKQETQIIGPMAAKLFVSSSTEDADLFLIFRVFTPDMKEITYSGSNDPHTPMAHGWLRASRRKLDPKLTLPYRPYHTHDESQKLEPGKVYELDIEVWPTCIVVPAGYRIGLTVRGKDYVYPGDLSGAGRIGQPATGVGPFIHAAEDDRPPAVFDNEVTLHFDAKEPPFILLPVIPS